MRTEEETLKGNPSDVAKRSRRTRSTKEREAATMRVL